MSPVVPFFALIITLAVILKMLNARFIKMPSMVVLMGFTLVLFSSLRLMKYAGLDFMETRAVHIFKGINLGSTVLDGFLCFLLFAGALSINIRELLDEKGAISLLATFGVASSTLIVGICTFVIAWTLNLNVPLIYCFVFGALIAPTDAVAVMSFLREAKIPHSLEVKFTGESLFNDGMSIMLFVVLLGMASGTATTSLLSLPLHIIWSIAGGGLIGFVLGYIANYALGLKWEAGLEIEITLALVLSTYVLATFLRASGPIAVVVAGLIIGNHGLRGTLRDSTSKNIETFWKWIDEILNSTLFVLIGVEALLLTLDWTYVVCAICVIPVVILGRYASIEILVRAMASMRSFSPHASLILTWGGLRGGISIALALSLPPGEIRDILLVTTYVTVIFSVLVMGLTMAPLLERLNISKK